MRTRIRELLHSDSPRADVTARGWVRTRRDAKEFSFLELNDGSCLANLQVIAPAELPEAAQVRRIGTGAAVAVHGELVASPGQGQRWELRAQRVELLGDSPDDYPLQKKRHTDEFLRGIAHLRARTNKYGALLRIRSRVAHEIHNFFQQRGFVHVHTPILTGSDCEGAGEMFTVTTLDLERPPRGPQGIDFSADFFGRRAHLTVSGQLEAETLALALGDVYTFGPTFRSENSNTSRHMAEFWMVEPEMAFADLADDMDLAEAFVQHLVRFTLEHCADDLSVFTRFVDKTLAERLEQIAGRAFVRLSYSEAIDILQRSGESFEFPAVWGADLQSEHERYLTERHVGGPVTVHDWPRDIKAFYMRRNDDTDSDRPTVAAMDLLVPSIGEIIGGSQREERLEPLRQRMQAMGLPEDDYWWYLDTRRFGTAPHAGFGLGFERLLMLLSGVGNIRDVMPFPRTPKHLEF